MEDEACISFHGHKTISPHYHTPPHRLKPTLHHSTSPHQLTTPPHHTTSPHQFTIPHHLARIIPHWSLVVHGEPSFSVLMSVHTTVPHAGATGIGATTRKVVGGVVGGVYMTVGMETSARRKTAEAFFIIFDGVFLAVGGV